MEQAITFKVRDRKTDRYFECRPEQSLLVAMERTHPGLIKVGCRGGGCGLCKIRILEGDYVTKAMSRKQVSVEEEAQGYTLACRSFAQSDLVFEVVADDQK